MTSCHWILISPEDSAIQASKNWGLGGKEFCQFHQICRWKLENKKIDTKMSQLLFEIYFQENAEGAESVVSD